jgi:parallel beta-helix repeat protein
MNPIQRIARISSGIPRQMFRYGHGIVVVLILLLLFAGHARGADMLVSTDCSARNEAETPGPACYPDIAGAVEAAVPGTIIWVDEGVYSGDVYINNSGREREPIAVTALPGKKPVIDNGYIYFGKKSAHIILSGLTIQNRKNENGIRFSNSSRSIQVRNCTIHHVGYNGIYLKGRDHLLQSNIIYETGRSFNLFKTHGIYVKAENSTVTGNLCYNNRGGNGIRIQGVELLIESNIVRDNESHGITVFSDIPTRSVTLSKNTVSGNGEYGIGILGGSGGNVPKGIVIANNLIFNNPINIAVIDGSMDVRLITNRVFNAGRYQLFVDRKSSPSLQEEANSFAGSGKFMDQGDIYENVQDYRKRPVP